MMMETTAAAHRIWFIVSSKLSMTSSQRDLMCGGGKLFSPKVSMRDWKSFSSPVIPKRRSVFRAVAKASMP